MLFLLLLSEYLRESEAELVISNFYRNMIHSQNEYLILICTGIVARGPCSVRAGYSPIPCLMNSLDTV